MSVAVADYEATGIDTPRIERRYTLKARCGWCKKLRLVKELGTSTITAGPARP